MGKIWNRISKHKRTWSRTRERHWKAFESAGSGTVSVSAWLSCTFYPRLHLSYIRRMLYIAWQGRLPRSSRRTTSTEPSNINISSPNRSSEPPLVLGVLRRSKSPHSGHYSSRKGFRVRNLDTATMASLFFCCLARWESKTALSGLLSAFPVCPDRAREKKGREREQADLIWRHVFFPRHKQFALEKKKENQTGKSQQRASVWQLGHLKGRLHIFA